MKKLYRFFLVPVREGLRPFLRYVTIGDTYPTPGGPRCIWYKSPMDLWIVDEERSTIDFIQLFGGLNIVFMG